MILVEGRCRFLGIFMDSPEGYLDGKFHKFHFPYPVIVMEKWKDEQSYDLTGKCLIKAAKVGDADDVKKSSDVLLRGGHNLNKRDNVCNYRK